jgi:hypothetical protein
MDISKGSPINHPQRCSVSAECGSAGRTPGDRRPKPAGLRVRSEVRAGDWSCEHCQGQVSGSQMIKPTCDLCYKI